jgi:hypothetical protein
VNFLEKSRTQKIVNLDTGMEMKTTGVGITHTMKIPVSDDPWQPPGVFQVLEKKKGAEAGDKNMKQLM